MKEIDEKDKIAIFGILLTIILLWSVYFVGKAILPHITPHYNYLTNDETIKESKKCLDANLDWYVSGYGMFSIDERVVCAHK